jgi:S-adenosylmethionine-dependent methyltransferase
VTGRRREAGDTKLDGMERTSGRTGPQDSPGTAVVWQVLSAEVDRQGGRPLTVVDVGGGTGGFAVPMAVAGHRVTVVDASPDALAGLVRRATDAGVADRVTAVQGDGDRLGALVPDGGADLVLCHSMLEVADSPVEVLRAVTAALRPGGAASVLVANVAAAVLSRVVAGHLPAAAALLRGPSVRADGRHLPRRRFSTADAVAALEGAGLVLEQIHGVRVLADLVPAAAAEADPAALRDLEIVLSTRQPYRDIAAQLHLLGRRPRT